MKKKPVKIPTIFQRLKIVFQNCNLYPRTEDCTQLYIFFFCTLAFPNTIQIILYSDSYRSEQCMELTLTRFPFPSVYKSSTGNLNPIFKCCSVFTRRILDLVGESGMESNLISFSYFFRTETKTIYGITGFIYIFDSVFLLRFGVKIIAETDDVYKISILGVTSRFAKRPRHL